MIRFATAIHDCIHSALQLCWSH